MERRVIVLGTENGLEFLDDFYKRPYRLVAFISYQLFTKGKLAKNLKEIDALGRELTEMGFVAIRPHTLAPHMIVAGKEVNRTIGLRICQAMILKSDVVIFNTDKISLGVQEELQFAHAHGVPIMEINYLRMLIKEDCEIKGEKK